MTAEPPPHRRLVVATSHPGKLDELRALLSDLPIELRGVRDVLARPPHVVEDGATFAENARKKARIVAAATGMLTLADDSGLEVDALQGRPGVRSARFARDGATDAENNAALLAALEGCASESEVAALVGGGLSSEARFAARFRCVLALVDPSGGGAPRQKFVPEWPSPAAGQGLGNSGHLAPGESRRDHTSAAQAHIAEGLCHGAITRRPRGAHGFGYDPLFVLASTDTTMAELSSAQKNRVSHRALAVAALRPLLAWLLESPERGSHS